MQLEKCVNPVTTVFWQLLGLVLFNGTALFDTAIWWSIYPGIVIATDKKWSPSHVVTFVTLDSKCITKIPRHPECFREGSVLYHRWFVLTVRWCACITWPFTFFACCTLMFDEMSCERLKEQEIQDAKHKCIHMNCLIIMLLLLMMMMPNCYQGIMSIYVVMW